MVFEQKPLCATVPLCHCAIVPLHKVLCVLLQHGAWMIEKVGPLTLFVINGTTLEAVPV